MDDGNRLHRRNLWGKEAKEITRELRAKRKDSLLIFLIFPQRVKIVRTRITVKRSNLRESVGHFRYTESQVQVRNFYYLSSLAVQLPSAVIIISWHKICTRNAVC